MTTRADITLKPTAGITPEQARDIRARAWGLVFDFYHRNVKEGGPATAPNNDGTKIKGDSADVFIVPR